jgi:hypothetical protein
MARPYSLDLLERAVARVAAGESVRSIAVVLQVSGKQEDAPKDASFKGSNFRNVLLTLVERGGSARSPHRAPACRPPRRTLTFGR